VKSQLHACSDALMVAVRAASASGDVSGAEPEDLTGLPGCDWTAGTVGHWCERRWDRDGSQRCDAGVGRVGPSTASADEWPSSLFIVSVLVVREVRVPIGERARPTWYSIFVVSQVAAGDELPIHEGGVLSADRARTQLG